MSDLLKLSLDDVSTKLKSKDVSATELAQEAFAACQAAQPALNAFTAFDEEKTMAMARAADERLAKGEGGLLEGVRLLCLHRIPHELSTLGVGECEIEDAEKSRRKQQQEREREH